MNPILSLLLSPATGPGGSGPLPGVLGGTTDSPQPSEKSSFMELLRGQLREGGQSGASPLASLLASPHAQGQGEAGPGAGGPTGNGLPLSLLGGKQGSQGPAERPALALAALQQALPESGDLAQALRQLEYGGKTGRDAVRALVSDQPGSEPGLNLEAVLESLRQLTGTGQRILEHLLVAEGPPSEVGMPPMVPPTPDRVSGERAVGTPETWLRELVANAETRFEGVRNAEARSVELTGAWARAVAQQAAGATTQAPVSNAGADSQPADASGLRGAPTGLEAAVLTAGDTPQPRANAATGAQQSPVLNMQQALGKPAWSNELGDRILWMARENVQSAKLRIHPPNLGPVEVRISVQQDQASVAFLSHHVQVRDALEGAIPRLREMMNEGGFQLADVDVSDQSSYEHRASADSEQSGEAADGPGLAGADGEEDSAAPQHARHDTGLVDYFV